MHSKVKVLITVPDLSRPGGVAALYNIAKVDQVGNVRYFMIHGQGKGGAVSRMLGLVLIYIQFALKVLSVKVVHINPSMTRKSYLRDGVFAWIALILGRKVLVYWHGWDSEYAASIPGGRIPSILLRKAYCRSNMHIVLGSCFIKELAALGIPADRIKIESNAASDDFLDNKNYCRKLPEQGPVRFLFIARLEAVKGIYTALDIIQTLSRKYAVHFDIAGGGSELDNVRTLVSGPAFRNIVTVHGNVAGQQKHDLFSGCHILLFPTLHKEGMPITILEAMMYGMPVFSTITGGIPDWVQEGVNGFLPAEPKVDNYVALIEEIIEDPTLYATISANNYRKAQDYFRPEAFIKRLLSYYENLSN